MPIMLSRNNVDGQVPGGVAVPGLHRNVVLSILSDNVTVTGVGPFNAFFLLPK